MARGSPKPPALPEKLQQALEPTYARHLERGQINLANSLQQSREERDPHACGDLLASYANELIDHELVAEAAQFVHEFPWERLPAACAKGALEECAFSIRRGDDERRHEIMRGMLETLLVRSQVSDRDLAWLVAELDRWARNRVANAFNTEQWVQTYLASLLVIVTCRPSCIPGIAPVVAKSTIQDSVTRAIVAEAQMRQGPQSALRSLPGRTGLPGL